MDNMGNIYNSLWLNVSFIALCVTASVLYSTLNHLKSAWEDQCCAKFRN